MTQEEKINVAKLLKNCPKNMELNCLMYEDVYFDYVDELNIIHCHILHTTYTSSLTFNQHGTPNSDIKSKCVIFPKGKTTWEGFVPPCQFKDGDIVATTNGLWIGITMGGKKSEFIPTYCVIQCDDKFEAYLDRKGEWMFNRFATEEEKKKLFDAIKLHGYKWNAETKTLEKLPKFKIGDKIIKKNGLRVPFVITGVSDIYYWSNTENSVEVLCIAEQDDWELVPNKFDINNLKPFDKVLVRDNNTQKWTADLFSFYDRSLVYPYSCVGHYTNQCVPFESNKHLLGKTDDCDEYFKTWEE